MRACLLAFAQLALWIGSWRHGSKYHCISLSLSIYIYIYICTCMRIYIYHLLRKWLMCWATRWQTWDSLYRSRIHWLWHPVSCKELRYYQMNSNRDVLYYVVASCIMQWFPVLGHGFLYYGKEIPFYCGATKVRRTWYFTMKAATVRQRGPGAMLFVGRIAHYSRGLFGSN